nr:nucleoside triphosphate pyrophosphohydrolase [Anaerolineae bacterium]
MTVVCVGLGPGDAGLITRRAWEVLKDAETVYLRTRKHPVVPQLPQGPVYLSFDDLYDSLESFSAVYKTIVEHLISKALEGLVVYAVPGDPMVAEETVTRLALACKEQEIPFKVVSGISFIEPALAAVGADAVPGLQLLDALELGEMYHPPINPDHPALIAQLYSRQVASDVKLTLMNQYPDNHPVTLVSAAGTDEQGVRQIPLYEIDRFDSAHLVSLYIPALGSDVSSFEGFQNTIAHLRSPEGCPWDREQNHQSLRKNLIEETYEVVDAIDDNDPVRIAEELGDLLLQIVLHAQIGVDEGVFKMPDVIRGIDAKIKRRHPHVWGTVDVHGSPDQVSINWEQIKAGERASGGKARASALDGIPGSMPSLSQAHEYDTRAARLGFDWPDETGVLEKIAEELEEVKTANTEEERFSEIGDLLFVVAVWARWLGVNPEDALRAANKRFYQRFTYLEQASKQQGRPLSEMTLDEMNALWDTAKEYLKSGNKDEPTE